MSYGQVPPHHISPPDLHAPSNMQTAMVKDEAETGCRMDLRWREQSDQEFRGLPTPGRHIETATKAPSHYSAAAVPGQLHGK